MSYSVLKFLHVASMAAWIGGVFTMLLLNRLIKKSGDGAMMQGLGRLGGAVSVRLFMPAMLVTVITGIGLVQIRDDLSFGSTWIVWGIAGVVVSFVLGGILTGGTARKLGQEMTLGTITPQQAGAVQRRILLFAILNLLVLLSILWAMVAKPA